MTSRAHARDWIEAAEGNADGAVAALEEALAGWRAMDLPQESARAMLDLAEVLLPEPSRTADAAAAARLLEPLGSRPAAERARTLLERLRAGADAGGNGQNGTDPRSPLAALTPRERDVLLELTEGKTNKQIARALSIRPKTVGNHVSSILAKLGCGTRTEASRIALTASSAGAHLDQPGSAPPHAHLVSGSPPRGGNGRWTSGVGPT